jgi:BNR repeat protein
MFRTSIFRSFLTIGLILGVVLSLLFTFLSHSKAATQFDTEQLWGTTSNTYWEPTVAADPSSNWVYQLTTNTSAAQILFRSSSDGGTTWGSSVNICPKDTPWQYDPQIKVSNNGTIYAACLNGYNNPGIVFTRSRNHGVTWTTSLPIEGTLNYGDKPILIVSSNGDDVYIGFNARLAFYVAVSHDSGKSFAPPVLATTVSLWYYSYGGIVSPNGTAYFAVAGETQVQNKETGTTNVELISSSDGGTTWSDHSFATGQEGAACTVKNCYPDFYSPQDTIAADKQGNLLFTYTKNGVVQGNNSLYVSRSRDGVNWTTPVVINALGNNTSPELGTGSTPGDFRIVWQDNRNGTTAWNTWYARSTNGGFTWSSAVRLSNLGSGTSYKSSLGYQFPFGDYLGLSVNSIGVNFVIWGEGANVYADGGTWYTRG